jgi:lysophospholipase L1-like esterase
VGVLALALAACRGHQTPVILCVGDSITAGFTRARQRDPAGGWPGRLQRHLGDRAAVVNRGLGGFGTADWLRDPTRDWFDVWGRSHAVWADAPKGPPPEGITTLLGGVLREAEPDVVVVLLGVNELGAMAREQHPGGCEIAEGLRALRAEITDSGAVALISTILPNRRYPAWLVDEVNRRIRDDHPDHLPLAERFAAAGWERLLGDKVHPNEQGHEILAGIVAEELTARGLVAGPPPATSSTRPPGGG